MNQSICNIQTNDFAAKTLILPHLKIFLLTSLYEKVFFFVSMGGFVQPSHTCPATALPESGPVGS
jgi:hypothetical protein